MIFEFKQKRDVVIGEYLWMKEIHDALNFDLL